MSLARRLLAIVAVWLIWSAASFVQADDVAEAVGRSITLEREAKYDEAVQTLTAVRKPSYLINIRLGWLHYLRAEYEKSKQFYLAAMRMQPKALEPRLGYTLPLMAEGRYAEVEAAAKSVLTMDANHYTAGLRMAFALRMQAKFRPAREFNARMLELYPTDVAFLTEQLLASVGGKQSDVGALCDTILALDPENATAKYYRPTTSTMAGR